MIKVFFLDLSYCLPALLCSVFFLYLSESLQMQRVCSDVQELGHGRRIGEFVEGSGRGVFSHNPLTKLKVNLVLEHATKTKRRRCIALLFF